MFRLALLPTTMPMKYFTSRDKAMTWLLESSEEAGAELTVARRHPYSARIWSSRPECQARPSGRSLARAISKLRTVTVQASPARNTRAIATNGCMTTAEDCAADGPGGDAAQFCRVARDPGGFISEDLVPEVQLVMVRMRCSSSCV